MSLRLRLTLLATLAALLAGCGGGGGGGGGSILRGTLEYSTDWTGAGGGLTGLSQRVEVFSLDGDLLGSVILPNTTTTTAQLTGIPQGLVRILVTLYPSEDAQGAQVGTVESVLRLDASEPFSTQVGSPLADISVTPETATITVGQTFPFSASGVDAGGVPVFTTTGAFTWQANGGVASISNAGVALGETEGTGSVVATHTASGETDAAVLTVTASTTVVGKWTILVFLNAANDLTDFDELNVNQMERAVGAGPNVRVVLQWKQALIPGVSDDPSFLGTRRYLVRPDNNSSIGSDLIQDMGASVDMGDPQTLEDFIAWGKQFYPADRYVLVVWNHGNGWRRKADTHVVTRGVSYDDETGNSIETWEMSGALGPGTFDILAWDASLMQMLEVDYELRNQVDLIVGSEESPPGAGYPYEGIVDRFVANPDGSTLDLAKGFVDETLLAYPDPTSSKITQSVLQASQLSNVAGAVDALADALIAEDTANPSGFAAYVQAARNNAQSYSPGFRVYRDIWDLTLELDRTVGAYAPPLAITSANAQLRAALSALILHEGHNAQSPDSHGLSIDFSTAGQYAGFKSDYELLDLATGTSWDEWLETAP